MRKLTACGRTRASPPAILKFNHPKRRDDSRSSTFFYWSIDTKSAVVPFQCEHKKDRMSVKEKFGLEIKNLFEDYPYLLQIMQNVQQVVWILDTDSDQIIYVSPAFETVWGRSSDCLYADSFALIETVHPEDRVKVMSIRLDEHHRSLNQIYRIVRPDGSVRWIEAHIFLIQERSGKISCQVCVAQDISSQNQVDQTLRKALGRSHEQFTLSRRMSLARKPDVVLKTLMSASELRTAKSAFIVLFESSQSGSSHEMEIIAAWSSNPALIIFNPSEQQAETRLFDNIALPEFFHPSRPMIITGISRDQRLAPNIRELLLEGQIHALAIFPMVVIGNWLGSLVVFFPHEKQFESVELRHIKVLVDQATITLYNLQLLEIEAESRHEAERANEIKTKFLAMISHELRTPLTSIIGFTTTLLADDVIWDPEEQRDFVLTIKQEADRLQELIDHLLDLSRLEAGMLPISQEPHPIQDIMEDALPQFHILTSGQKLTINLPANLPQVYVDAKRIAQVLVNLVRNASVYAPQGSEINISASMRGSYVQMSVSDQGPGIPPAERKKVFKAFQRGVNVESGVVKGAGLGLAICKGLVEAHGGRIWIKKKTTPGATITFTLPTVPSPAVALDLSQGR
jgi:PAS domain S-box-containing protein